MSAFTAYRVQVIEQNTKITKYMVETVLANGKLNLVTGSSLTISSRRRCDTPAPNGSTHILGPPYLHDRNASGGLSDG